MKNSITTPSQLIDALGGTSTVARLLEVGMPAVSQIKKRGIPQSTATKLFDMALAAGLDFDRAIFGLETKECHPQNDS